MAFQLTQVAYPESSTPRLCQQPSLNANLSLKEAYQAFKFNGNEALAVPFRVRLLDNARSLIALPGCPNPFNYDCLHILLNRSTSREDTAFVFGFIMGSNPKVTVLHLKLLKQAARWLYRGDERCSKHTCHFLADGFDYGRQPQFRNLYRLKFQDSQHLALEYLRRHLEIDIS